MPCVRTDVAMAREVIFDREAARYFGRLDRITQERIASKLDALAEHPTEALIYRFDDTRLCVPVRAAHRSAGTGLPELARVARKVHAERCRLWVARRLAAPSGMGRYVVPWVRSRSDA